MGGHHHHQHLKADHALVRRCALYSILTSLALIIIKGTGWMFTRSVALQAALLDSLQDLVTSSINFVAIHHAQQPADAEHRFGHGKLESIASLVQAIIIMGTGLYVLFEAIERFINPKTLPFSWPGIIAIVLASIIGVMLVRYQEKVIKETGSMATAGDSLHYKTDIIINAGVLISLSEKYWFIDPVLGIIIAGYIMHAAYQLVREAMRVLMDQEISHDMQEQIIAIIKSETRAHGFHDFKSRSSGDTVFVQFHLELDGNMPLKEAHIITDNLEQQIMALFKSSEVTIHQDPREQYSGNAT